MLSFYRDQYSRWYIDGRLTTPYPATMKIDSNNIVTISSIAGDMQDFVVPLSDIVDINNTQYLSYQDLVNHVGDFFADALVREGCPRTVYKSAAKLEITNLNETSLFSDTYAGVGRLIPANSLRVGSVILIKANGLFTTASGATSSNKMMFGNTLLESSEVTYLNNRTNYYIESEIMLTIRSVGTTGSIVYQGRDLVQTSELQYTLSMQPRKILVPITINTTIDNLFDLRFKWGSAGNSIIVSNLIMQIL
jgi:hypothetical protein